MSKKEDAHQYYLALTEEQKERRKKTLVAWRKDNPEKTKEYDRITKAKLKLDVLVHYSSPSPSCARCGISDVDVLCIDHINNDGQEHRKITGLGSGCYQWLKTNKYPEGFQVLCWNCNHKKEITRRRNENN